MLSDLNKNVLILIPALNPTEEFDEYIQELIKNNFKNIVVIDDGSDDNSKPIFEKISKNKECYVIHHEKNCGKGKSLKDGLKYFSSIKNNLIGVITVDCDGQHLVKDINYIYEKMLENPNTLLLGCRDFSKRKCSNKK